MKHLNLKPVSQESYGNLILDSFVKNEKGIDSTYYVDDV